MKKALLIGVLLFLLNSLVLSQVSEKYRLFENKEFDTYFFDTTFLLSKNPRPNKISIATAYKMQKGDFCSPLRARDTKGGVFETSAFLSLSKWKLYGLFYYHNLFSEKSLSLLSAFNDAPKTPIFFMQKKSSPTQTILYAFNAFASRKIFDDKTYLGLKLYYEGGTFYKKSDWRNTQHLLKLTGGISIGRELPNAMTIGIDILMNADKTKPSLSSVYQHGYDDEQYKHYINIGFGTLEQQPRYSFEVQTLSPVFSLFLQKDNGKTTHTWRIKGQKATCIWKDLLIKDTRLFNKPYKNEQLRFSADYLLKVSEKEFVWHNLARINFLQGKTFWQEDNRTNYSQTAWTKKIMLSNTLVCSRKVGFWREAQFQAGLFSRKIRDKNYGNKLNYSKLILDLQNSFSLKKLLLSESKLTLGIAYTNLLNSKKIENASLSKQFMSLIGNDFVDYWRAESIGYSAKFDYKISKKKDSHLFVSTSYLQKLSTEKMVQPSSLFTVLLGMKIQY